MAIIIFYSLFYLTFIFIDLIPIYKNKQRKLFWIYLIMTVFSYTIIILIGVGVRIPSPALIIKNVITSIFQL